MKKWLGILGLGLVVALSACGKKESASTIVGTWISTAQNGVAIAERNAEFNVYTANGNFEEQTIKGVATNGDTYKLEGTKITYGSGFEGQVTLTPTTLRITQTGTTNTFDYRKVSDQEKAAISARN